MKIVRSKRPAASGRKLTVYFYHTQDTRQIFTDWSRGVFPAHLLYGATHLPEFGQDVIYHWYGPQPPQRRWLLTLLTPFRILLCPHRFDVLYATSFRGLELVILLRALRLFRRPIVLWHHQPVVKAKSPFREFFARIFYKGIDRMFFFSQPIVDDSLRSGKADSSRMQVVPWGADLDFYDGIVRATAHERTHRFVSTGKEQRDMPTLIHAFASVPSDLDIYVSPSNGGVNYADILGQEQIPDNVHVHVIRGFLIRELAQVVSRSGCVVICCRRTNYTVGLTTLVEALALGLPIVCTRNITFPFDCDVEGVGITVDYDDRAGWERALRWIVEHPAEAGEMGRRARRLAEERFNIRHTASIVSQALFDITGE